MLIDQYFVARKYTLHIYHLWLRATTPISIKYSAIAISKKPQFLHIFNAKQEGLVVGLGESHIRDFVLTKTGKLAL